MPLADAVAGTLRPGQRITWTRDDGTPEDLSGATLSGILRRLPDRTTRAIVGTLVVNDGPSGIFDWNYAAGDVVAGQYEVQFSASFGAGATPARTFLTSWIVHEAPAITP